MSEIWSSPSRPSNSGSAASLIQRGQPGGWTRVAVLGSSFALMATACGGGGGGAHTNVVTTNGGSGANGGQSGSSGSSGSSTGGTSGGGAVPVQMCAAGTEMCKATTTLPAGAPVLAPGTWKNISPAMVPFDNADPNNPVFTQGIAVDPCDSATLYLCIDGFNPSAANAGLYKSTDAGTTWARIGRVTASYNGIDHIDEPIHIRIDPKNSQHMYVVDGVRGGTGGFWVSCDGGENFTLPDVFATLQMTQGVYSLDAYDVAVDPSDFNHALVSSHSPWGNKYPTDAGVLETKDGGSNWTFHAPPPGAGYGHSITFLYNPALKIGDSNTWLLSTQSETRWRTTDGGSTWKQVSTIGITHGGGTFYYDSKGVLYASGNPSNSRSTDNGLTWVGIGGAGSGSTAIIGDGTTLYSAPAGGPTSFYTSPESDGVTWTAYNAQQFEQGPFEMAYDSPNKILYSGTWLAGMWALKVQ